MFCVSHHDFGAIGINTHDYSYLTLNMVRLWVREVFQRHHGIGLNTRQICHCILNYPNYNAVEERTGQRTSILDCWPDFERISLPTALSKPGSRSWFGLIHIHSLRISNYRNRCSILLGVTIALRNPTWGRMTRHCKLSRFFIQSNRVEMI